MNRPTYILLWLLSFQALASEINYEFDIDYHVMNQTGRNIEALAIGGTIPGPTIKATVGDILTVTFNNKLNEETSIHWHGVLLPNKQDGVPYLTTPPIKPGQSWTFTYPIIHSGTYWYHSHSGLQEQRGLYGSMIFYPKDAKSTQQAEEVLVFSDWSDEHPNNIFANLKKDDDYYALKKGSVQSWAMVLKHGSQAVKNRLQGAWTRMGPMDISDVGYDAFLVNGNNSISIDHEPGKKIKLRLINAAASSYIKVQYAGGPMTVIAADGVDVEPFDINLLTLTMAETYDLLVTVPDIGRYELRANAEDGTGYSSTYIGTGAIKHAPDYQPPNVYLTSHEHHDAQTSSGHSIDSSMSHESTRQPDEDPHAHHAMPSLLKNNEESNQNPSMDEINSPKHPHTMAQHQVGNEYDSLRATYNTAIDEAQPLHEVVLELTGFMDGYSWSFNKVPFSESEKILIKKGQRVRFKLINKTMMHHPLHLHGHFFRVINKHGDYSPLKHTVNVPAMGEQTIEFDANEEKDWFFHCHNLYHMKSGMSRIISYGEDPELGPYLKKNIMHDDMWFTKAELSFLNNMTFGEAKYFNYKHALVVEYDYDWDRAYDVEILYERFITRYLDVFVGGNFEREHNNEKSENTAIVGFHYTLPLLIESELRVNSNGDFRLQLGSDLQLLERLNFEWMVNTDKEYRLGLTYELNKKMMLTAVYDSDFDFGVGIKISL